MRNYCFCILLLLLVKLANAGHATDWLEFEAAQPNGKHIVLIAGDEEYRSEETLPMLAKILSTHHGFKTTVLFPIHGETGEIDPAYQNNIPGLHHLKTADLMVIATRFRNLPDEQMKYIDDYLRAAKPVIGLRTATHAFNYGKDSESAYAKYGYSSKHVGWEGGFGKKILGETWVDHHGHHGKEGTRGLVDGIARRNKDPILNGVQDIWGPSDVYGITDLPASAEVLVWGQVTKGMTAGSEANLDKGVLPIAWTGTYAVENGRSGRVFTTTMGASVDFLSEDLRRLFVNACYWAVDLSGSIPEKGVVDFVGNYNPLMFGFGTHKKGLKPADYR